MSVQPTAPYLADTEALLRTSIGLVVQVTTHAPGGALLGVVDVEDLQLSFDEARAPWCEAAITARVPREQAGLDALDPRAGVRLRVRAGYARPDGVHDVHTLADLGLRDRQVTRPSNRLQLTASGDEALVIDYLFGGAVYIPDQDTLTDAIGDLLTKALGRPVPLVSTVAPAPPGQPLLIREDVTTWWKAIDDLADRQGAEVYDDGTRTFHHRPRPTLATTPAVRLAVGAEGTVLTSSTALTREGWRNAAMIVYTWEEFEPTPTGGAVVTKRVVGTARATTGPLAAVDGNASWYREARAGVRTTQAEADAAAAAVLARRLSDGQGITLAAIAALWVRPGMTVTVTLPLGPTRTYLVSAVTFDLPAGRMTLRLRTPAADTTITPGA